VGPISRVSDPVVEDNTTYELSPLPLPSQCRLSPVGRSVVPLEFTASLEPCEEERPTIFYLWDRHSIFNAFSACWSILCGGPWRGCL
jgi:hypothetical protein